MVLVWVITRPWHMYTCTVLPNTCVVPSWFSSFSTRSKEWSCRCCPSLCHQNWPGERGIRGCWRRVWFTRLLTHPYSTTYPSSQTPLLTLSHTLSDTLTRPLSCTLTLTPYHTHSYTLTHPTCYNLSYAPSPTHPLLHALDTHSHTPTHTHFHPLSYTLPSPLTQQRQAHWAAC